MTRTIVVIVLALLAIIVTAVVTTLVVIAVRHRAADTDHPGVQATTPPLPPARERLGTRPPSLLPEPLVGRHHEDTVRRVAEDWMPKRRVEAWDDTQVIRPIRDGRRP